MTIVIIVIVLVVLYYSGKEIERADKVSDIVNHQERMVAIRQLPNISYAAHQKSTIEKVLSLSGDSSSLSMFSYSNSCICVGYQDGKQFSINLERADIIFRFAPAYNARIAELIINGQKVTISEDIYLLNTAEWDDIFYILSLAHVTHHKNVLDAEYRKNAVTQYKQQQQIQRNMRQIQRFNNNFRGF